MKIKFTKKEKKLAKLFAKENYVYVFSRMYGQEIDDYGKQVRSFLKYGILEKSFQTYTVTKVGRLIFSKL